MIVIVIVTIMRNHIFSSLACLFIMQSFEDLLPQHLVRVMEDTLREKTKSNLGSLSNPSHCWKSSAWLLITVQRPVVTMSLPIYQTDAFTSLNTWDQQSWELGVTGSTPWIPPLFPCIIIFIIIITSGLVLLRPWCPECFLDGCPLLPREGVNAQS